MLKFAVPSSHRFSLAMLAFAALALSAPAQADRFQKDWKPNRYKVECTRKKGDPSGPCLNADGQGRAISLFVRATTRLKAMGWRPPKNFGPVKGEGADEHVVVYSRPIDKFAFTEKNCAGPAHSAIFLGLKYQRWSHAPQLLAFFIAHELFHVVQMSYYGCSAPAWVNESTATALGIQVSKREYPTRFPGRTKRETRMFAGLRHYDQPLNLRLRKNGKEVRTGALPYYYTVSFWQHLADIYHKGSYNYLKSYLRAHPKKPGGDWLGWLHRRLLLDPKIKQALGPVYTLFVADYAGWGHSRGPGRFFGTRDWQKESFSGCREITLTPDKPWVKRRMSLQRTSAKCVKVKVKGLEKGQRASVNVAAIHPPRHQAFADTIHLGLVSSTDKKKFHCAKWLRNRSAKRRAEARKRCVFQPNTGRITVGNENRAARLWDVVAQEARASTFENTYVVARVSPNPVKGGRGSEGGKVLAFDMAFVADFSTLKVANKSKATGAKKRVVGALNMQPSNDAQEKAPKYNANGQRAHAYSGEAAAFGVNMPNVNMPALPVAGSQNGIAVLRFVQVNAEETGLYSGYLRDEDMIAATPLKNGKNYALRLGDTGIFAANLSGKLGRDMVGATEPARLKVTEFSPYMLRAELQGNVCRARDIQQGRCSRPIPVKATMVKAFAGLHLPKARFTVSDTPSTKQYRQRLGLGSGIASFNKGRDTTPTGSGTGGGLFVPGRNGVVMMGRCACHCDDAEKVREIEEELKDESNISPETMRLIRGKAICMGMCDPVYSKCLKKKRKNKMHRGKNTRPRSTTPPPRGYVPPYRKQRKPRRNPADDLE